MKKVFNKTKKQFATMETKILELENESDSDSDITDETGSNFLLMKQCYTQTMGYDLKEQLILHTKYDSYEQLDLRNVMLLDNQSKLDLICNKNLATKIEKSNCTITVQDNGGTLDITHRAKFKGYISKPWFRKKAITNIFSFKNMIKQYIVTYDSNEKMFVVHRKESGIPNM